MFDEVQAGLGLTGKMWSYEHYDVRPDMVAFGKKTQVCGFICGPRIDEIEDNVFRVSSRLNSTWGGTLVDMVRSGRYLEIMAEEKLLQNAAARGQELLAGLESLQKELPDHLSNARGKGLMCAFDFKDTALRDKVIAAAYEEGVVVIASFPPAARGHEGSDRGRSGEAPHQRQEVDRLSTRSACSRRGNRAAARAASQSTAPAIQSGAPGLTTSKRSPPRNGPTARARLPSDW